MDFAFTPEEDDFRRELRAFLDAERPDRDPRLVVLPQYHNGMKRQRIGAESIDRKIIFGKPFAHRIERFRVLAQLAEDQRIAQLAVRRARFLLERRFERVVAIDGRARGLARHRPVTGGERREDEGDPRGDVHDGVLAHVPSPAVRVAESCRA